MESAEQPHCCADSEHTQKIPGEDEREKKVKWTMAFLTMSQNFLKYGGIRVSNLVNYGNINNWTKKVHCVGLRTA